MVVLVALLVALLVVAEVAEVAAVLMQRSQRKSQTSLIACSARLTRASPPATTAALLEVAVEADAIAAAGKAVGRALVQRTRLRLWQPSLRLPPSLLLALQALAQVQLPLATTDLRAMRATKVMVLPVLLQLHPWDVREVEEKQLLAPVDVDGRRALRLAGGRKREMLLQPSEPVAPGADAASLAAGVAVSVVVGWRRMLLAQAARLVQDEAVVLH